MSRSELDQLLISQFLWQLPLIALWLTGLIIALVSWKRHPRVSALTLTAMAVLIGQAFFSALASFVMMSYSIANPVALTIVRMIFEIPAFILIFMAIFGGPQPHRRYAPPAEVLSGEHRPAPRAGLDAPPDAIRE